MFTDALSVQGPLIQECQAIFDSVAAQTGLPPSQEVKDLRGALVSYGTPVENSWGEVVRNCFDRAPIFVSGPFAKRELQRLSTTKLRRGT